MRIRAQNLFNASSFLIDLIWFDYTRNSWVTNTLDDSVGREGEAAGGVEVHMDGEEHRAGAGSRHPGARDGAVEPVLLLAQERCMGRAQGYSREQAMDLPEEDDHPPQSSHRHHQPLATKWRQSLLNHPSFLVIFWLLNPKNLFPL